MTSPARLAFVRTAVAVVLAPALLVAAPDQRQTREQRVFVTALGENDVPVRDLTAADFVVRENDVAREVIRAAAAPPPSHIALLVDTSQAADPVMLDLRRALTAFVRKIFAVAPSAQISMTTFGERPTRVVEFTSDPGRLTQQIDRLFAVTGSGAYLLETIQETNQILRKREVSRPVMVAFVAEEGPEFSNLTHDQIESMLKGTGTALWVIALQGRDTNAQSQGARERGLVVGDVTTRSGGMVKPLLSRQALEAAFLNLATQLSSQYELTYARPEALIPPDRIEVTTRRKDVRVLASRWIR